MFCLKVHRELRSQFSRFIMTFPSFFGVGRHEIVKLDLQWTSFFRDRFKFLMGNPFPFVHAFQPLVKSLKMGCSCIIVKAHLIHIMETSISFGNVCPNWIDGSQELIPNVFFILKTHPAKYLRGDCWQLSWNDINFQIL